MTFHGKTDTGPEYSQNHISHTNIHSQIHGKPNVPKIQKRSTSGSRNGCALVPDKGQRWFP